MSESIGLFKELYNSPLLSLSKEELIKMICLYHNCCFKIGETCVEESKEHIEPDKAIDKIRNYLRSVDFKFYDIDTLKENLERNI